MLVTSLGYLYGVGEYIMNAVNKAPHEGEARFTKLKLPEHLKAYKAWASRAKYCQAIIVDVENELTHERYLVSIGKHMSSLLGTNTDENEDFKILDYDYKHVQFEKVSLLTNHALAVTRNGELYGWGSNVNRKLGFSEDTVLVSKPTLVPYFSDRNHFKVIDVACGDEHSFVHVEEFDDLGVS